MRVLHVIARLPSSGTERQLIGMLLAARDRHWQPELCVLYPGSPLVAEVREAGIPVTELRGSAASAARVRDLRRLSRRGFDVVHSSLWGGNALTRAACAGPGRPALVVSERRVEDFRSAPRRALDRALRRVTEHYTGNSADVTSFIARAHGVPPERITMIRNGMDRSVFHPPAVARAAPDGRRPLRVGAVGRLVDQKGFDVLVAGVPALLEQRDVEVVVVGEGELRPRLEAAASGLPVSFPGALATPGAVADFLRTLDVFVMPSRYEGLPNALLEAAACGVPVVATDVPGSSEAADAVTRFVPAESPAELARAVLEVADLLRAGPADRPAGPGVASFDEVAAAHLEVFRAAAERRRTGGRRAAAA